MQKKRLFAVGKRLPVVLIGCPESDQSLGVDAIKDSFFLEGGIKFRVSLEKIVSDEEYFTIRLCGTQSLDCLLEDLRLGVHKGALVAVVAHPEQSVL
ncbi:hypothetical protein LK07_24090 [Streptomyces pluripotens]|uniref:Uncharacterized protein n=1 Tax=Streptomyces pluripotens TaxID=1355015 RepID=A0A221P340_9ACTN|nr:hypothetical protein LK06_022925 [Streptomyces pluripotens]ASN26582.1 hypothetical protein LK07_24090 [Streptomyces pluripotens]